MTTETETMDKGPKSFDKLQTKTAVKALLKYVSKKKSDALFLDASARFLLDITAFKTPTGAHQYYNIILPHSPYPVATESLDILLIVRDVTGVEAEHVVGQVKDELMSSSATRDKLKVRQIMTLKQLKDDYSTFEAKRALAKTVDVVIVEHKLFKMMPRLLGREFQKKKKFHLGIPGRQFKDKDLGEQILFALKKSVLHISLKGQTSTMVIGNDNLKADELAENVSKIAYWLKKKFPGGWKNIQKLSLHTGEGGMPPLVVYFSTGSANDVKKPPVTKGGSIPEPTEGELSTQPGSHIKIHATGEIEVLERKRISEEDKELIAALGDKPRKGKNPKEKTPLKKEVVKKVEKVENSGDEEDDDDDDMEEEQDDGDEMDDEEEEGAVAEEDSVEEEEMSEDDDDE